MDFIYLAPDLSKIQSYVVTENMIKTTQNGRIKRLIFQNVKYDDFETQKILELKKFLKKQGVDSYDDVTLLKFLYLSEFDFMECIKRINIYQEWRHNPLIQGNNKKGESILKEGTLYCYGRDYEFRPVIIFRVSEIDLNKHPISEYYWALNKLMKPIESIMLVPGKVEKVLIILDIDHKNLAIPITTDYQKIISKISTAYMHRAHKIIMINTSFLCNLIYKFNQKQIESEASQMLIINSDNLYKLKQYISPNQLEIKYGGTKPNLTKYWPIQCTNNEIMIRRKQMKQYFGEQESSFESLNNSETRFNGEVKKQHCCCECILF